MKILIVISLFLTTLSFASQQPVTSPQPTSHGSASLSANAPLEVVSSGIRSKSILVFGSVKVYEAKLMIPKGASLSKTATGAAGLNSLMSMNSFAMTLKLLRDVDSATLVKGFDDALKHNKVADSVGLETLKTHLKKTPKMPSGHQITLTANRAGKKFICTDGSQTIEIADDDGNLARAIFSIWLGEPYDTGLRDLKAQLLK